MARPFRSAFDSDLIAALRSARFVAALTGAGISAESGPDVVWFEEILLEQPLAAADAAVRRCNVLLVIGTSAEVYPAAALPALARLTGATVVEINPEATPLSATADFALRGAAGIVLPALVAALD
jgi:NAD-dependent deacetylase